MNTTIVINTRRLAATETDSLSGVDLEVFKANADKYVSFLQGALEEQGYTVKVNDDYDTLYTTVVDADTYSEQREAEIAVEQISGFWQWLN